MHAWKALFTLLLGFFASEGPDPIDAYRESDPFDPNCPCFINPDPASDDPAHYTLDPLFGPRYVDLITRDWGGRGFLDSRPLPRRVANPLGVLRDLANPFRGRDAPVLGGPEERTRFFEGDPDPRLEVNGGYLPEGDLGPLDPPSPLDPAYTHVIEVVEAWDFSIPPLPYWDLQIKTTALGGAEPLGPYDILDVYVVETMLPSPADPDLGDCCRVPRRRKSFYIYLPDGPDMLREPDGSWVQKWNGLADPDDPRSPPSDHDIIDVNPVVPRYSPGGEVGFGGDHSGSVPFFPPSDPVGEPMRGDELRSGPGPFCSGPGLDDPLRCPNGREPDGRSVTVQNAIDGLIASRGLRPFSNVFLTGGAGELPLRPAPDRSNRDLSPDPGLQKAQGLYIPSAGLRRALEDGDLDSHGFRGRRSRDPVFLYERNVDLATGRPVVTRFAGGTPGPQERAGCASPSSGSFDLVWDGGAGLRLPIPGVDDGAATVSLGFDHPQNPGSTSPRGIGIEDPCLKAGGEAGFQGENEFGGAQNALYHHYANQQLYAAICSATVGSSKIDTRACALNLLNSNQPLMGIVDFPMIEFATALAAGDTAANIFVRAVTNRVRRDKETWGVGPLSPMRPLNRDRGPVCNLENGSPFDTVEDCLASLEAGGWDGIITAKDKTFNRPDPDAPRLATPEGGTRNCANSNLDVCRRYSFHYDPGEPGGTQADFLTLDSVLSNQQRALLGCGPPFGTRCDSSDAVLLYDTDGNEGPVPLIPAGGGIDLLNADAEFLAQAWAGAKGARGKDLTASLRAAFEEAEIGRQQMDAYCQGAGQDFLVCKFLALPEEEGGNRFGTPYEPTWLTTAASLLQPQVIRLSDGAIFGKPQPCTVFDEASGKLEVLPGCRGIEKIDVQDDDEDGIPDRFEVTFQRGYRPWVDGCPFGGGETGYEIGGVPTTAVAHDGGPVEGLEWCRKQLANPDPNIDDPRFTDADGYTVLYGSNSRIATPAHSENFATAVTGAQPLFHPLAGCLSDGEAASVDPRVTGQVDPLGNVVEAGNVCRFYLRDFASELSGEGLDLRGEPTGRGPANVFLFRSEGAALSFNAQMALVWTSCNGDPEAEILSDPECFDPFDAYSPQRCSFAAPQLCENVRAFFALTGVQRTELGQKGPRWAERRAFLWHGGQEVMPRGGRRN